METVDYLNPELRGKFRIKNTHLPRVLNTPVGDIHFGTLTEAQAEQLVAGDFYYLEKLPAEEVSQGAKSKVKAADAEAAVEPESEVK